MTRTATIVFVSIAVLILITVVCLRFLRPTPAEQRRAVFVQAWEIIGSNYYDRQMGGLDWRLVRENYEKRLARESNSLGFYWNVLIPMASLLESSHVNILPPLGGSKAEGMVSGGSLDVRNPNSCGGGFRLTEPRRPLSPRVKRVNQNSRLYLAGVRPGWRLAGANFGSGPESVRTVTFTSSAGENVEFPFQSFLDEHDSSAKLLRADFEALIRLSETRPDPETELAMDSLGITVSIGYAAKVASVVDVENGSFAERAGIEPGSELVELHSSAASTQEIQLSLKVRSPAGEIHSASYKYRSCSPQNSGADRISSMLTGNVLYLRFDGYEEGTVNWLDEQLRRKPRALILDLRHNHGGELAVMQSMLSRFLEPGLPIATNVFPDHSEPVHATDSSPRYVGSMAVLVSPLTLSAAEVTSNALRFHKRATLYGKATAGSVLLSRTFPLADGGTVQVAIADVRGPDGRRLERVGVEVDHEVSNTLQAIRAGRDLVLEAALADLAQTTH